MTTGPAGVEVEAEAKPAAPELAPEPDARGRSGRSSDMSMAMGDMVARWSDGGNEGW